MRLSAVLRGRRLLQCAHPQVQCGRPASAHHSAAARRVHVAERAARPRAARAARPAVHCRPREQPGGVSARRTAQLARRGPARRHRAGAGPGPCVRGGRPRLVRVRSQRSDRCAHSGARFHHRSTLRADHRPLGRLPESAQSGVRGERLGNVCGGDRTESSVEVRAGLEWLRHTHNVTFRLS